MSALPPTCPRTRPSTRGTRAGVVHIPAPVLVSVLPKRVHDLDCLSSVRAVLYRIRPAWRRLAEMSRPSPLNDAPGPSLRGVLAARSLADMAVRS